MPSGSWSNSSASVPFAWEEDWTTAYEIDRYLATGQGDPVSLVGQMTGQWQSRETVELFRRLRAFNAHCHDPVRFIGVEYYYTGRLAYDAVDAYRRGRSATDTPHQGRSVFDHRPSRASDPVLPRALCTGAERAERLSTGRNGRPKTCAAGSTEPSTGSPIGRRPHTRRTCQTSRSAFRAAPAADKPTTTSPSICNDQD